MPTIDKEILVNAPLDKIFSYVSKPSNLPQIWPSLIEIKNEQLLPNGRYNFEWVYKMTNLHLEGTGRNVCQHPFFSTLLAFFQRLSFEITPCVFDSTYPGVSF